MSEYKKEIVNGNAILDEINRVLQKGLDEKKIDMPAIGVILECLSVNYCSKAKDPLHILDFLYDRVKEQLPDDRKTPDDHYKAQLGEL